MPAPTNNPCRSQPAGDSANPNNKNPKAEPKTHSHQTAQQCPPTHTIPVGASLLAIAPTQTTKIPKLNLKPTHIKQPNNARQPTTILVGPMGPVGLVGPVGAGLARDDASPSNTNAELTPTITSNPHPQASSRQNVSRHPQSA